VVQASDWGYKLRKLTKSTAVMDWNCLTTCNIDAKILWIFWSNNEGLLNVSWSIICRWCRCAIAMLSELPCSMEDLWHALRRMKANLCDDDAGLAAALMKFL